MYIRSTDITQMYIRHHRSKDITQMYIYIFGSGIHFPPIVFSWHPGHPPTPTTARKRHPSHTQAKTNQPPPQECLSPGLSPVWIDRVAADKADVQSDLEDEAGVLASNGINKDRHGLSMRMWSGTWHCRLWARASATAVSKGTLSNNKLRQRQVAC